MSSISLNYALKINLIHKNQQYDLETTLEILEQIQQTGNLRAASNQCGYSYRKTWNILKQLETLFGSPLVEKQPGKGTQLSGLGQILLDTTAENRLLFKDSLLSAENQVNKAVSTVISKHQRIRIIASDSEKLVKLRQQHSAVEIHFDGSGQALSAYAEGKCELAGFHIGVGGKNHYQFNEYCQYFDPVNDQFVLLERRQQGLMSHPGRQVNSLQQLVDQQLTFVNRQQGSGTRLLLDSLLDEQAINSNQVRGYYHEEHTHLAVASMIISRQADAGPGIKSMADRLKLHFTPFGSELYFLVFKSKTPKIQLVLNELLHQDNIEIINYKEFVKSIIDKP